MATNDFLPFCATDTGSNLLSQADYSVDAQRPIGNQPGVARLKLVNKAVRQAAWIASQLAQFLANQTGDNVLDDQNSTNILATMAKAIGLNATPAVFNETQAMSTDGGSFVQNIWQTRILNTTQTAQSWASLSSNQITLAKGVYNIHASAPAYAVFNHQARFQNITDSSTAILGTIEYTQGTTNQGRSVVMGTVTIAASKTFELQHQCTSSENTNGFGIAGGITSEVYSVISIQKVG